MDDAAARLATGAQPQETNPNAVALNHPLRPPIGRGTPSSTESTAGITVSSFYWSAGKLTPFEASASRIKMFAFGRDRTNHRMQ